MALAGAPLVDSSSLAGLQSLRLGLDATEELSRIPDRTDMEEGAKRSILMPGNPGRASQHYKTLSVSTVAEPQERMGLSRIITMLIISEVTSPWPAVM